MDRMALFEFEANESYVELCFADGTMVCVDRAEAEAGLIKSQRDQFVLDTLAFNDPFAYVKLMLQGNPKTWLEQTEAR